MIENETAAVRNGDEGDLRERLFLAALCFALTVNAGWIGAIGFAIWWLFDHVLL